MRFAVDVAVARHTSELRFAFAELEHEGALSGPKQLGGYTAPRARDSRVSSSNYALADPRLPGLIKKACDEAAGKGVRAHRTLAADWLNRVRGNSTRDAIQAQSWRKRIEAAVAASALTREQVCVIAERTAFAHLASVREAVDELADEHRSETAGSAAVELLGELK